MPAFPAATVAARARALWPHLDALGVTDDTLEAWQSWAETLAGPAFGAARLDAVCHLVAHAGTRATAAEGGGPAGEVTSVSTLSLSASFAAPGGAGPNAELRTTRPGQAYLALRGAIPAITLPRVVA